MQSIQAIIRHGDLTDVAFIAKKLKAKFSSDYFYMSDGKPDRQTLIYQSDYVLGSPIHVTLNIHTTKPERLKYGWIAIIYFESRSFPDPDANFIDNCLHISGADFFSYFGGEYSPDGISGASPLPPGAQIKNSPPTQDESGPFIVGYNQTQGILGKNSSRIWLSFAYGQRSDDWPDKFLNSVSIKQN